MIHLRIVAPSDTTEQVLELLRGEQGAVNLIHLAGAAEKPEGDVVLCDLAREDASLILADLRKLRVHERGSIAIEDIDAELSRAAEKAKAAATGLPSDAVVWEEVQERTAESTELSISFLAFMILATQIAAIGILIDSQILIIGAMVVGPEFGPLAGLCVALVSARGELARRSATALVVGFPVAIGAALVLTLVLKATGVADDVLDPGERNLTAFISNPDAYSFIVAYLAGTAGVLTLTTSKSSALVGVLISVTTIPAAANVGVAAAYGDWDEMWGALQQLGLNLTAILAAGIATLWVQRRWYIRRLARR